MGSRLFAAGTALAIGLTGCAPTVWTKPGASEDQREADLAGCEAYAREQTEDFVARIEDTQRGVTTDDQDSTLADDFRRFDERSRRDDLIEDCMRQLGYSEGEPRDDSPSGAAGAADDAS